MIKKIGYLLLLLTATFAVIYLINVPDKNKLSVHSHSYSKVEKNLKEDINGEFDERDTITQIIDQMTIDEKIGQLIFAGISGTVMSEKTLHFIHKYKLGGMILFSNNLENPEQSIELLNQIKLENQQNDLPIFLGVDQEGGRVERLPGLKEMPSNLEIATSNRKGFSYDIGKLLAMQLHAFGFNVNFAPVLDINSNPNNPVIGDRSFGDHAKVVSELGIETMRGMQSENMITAVKHFPGHGDTDVDSHLELPEVDKSLNELFDLELIPFQAVIEQGADIVMTAHILLPQIDLELPASLSEKVITRILRNELDFSGVVMTDDMTMKAITNQFEIGEAAVQSIKAGTDIILMAHNYDDLVAVYESLQKAVKNEEITEERINESLQRIIKLKLDYDIDDEQVDSIDIEALNQQIAKQLHDKS